MTYSFFGIHNILMSSTPSRIFCAIFQNLSVKNDDTIKYHHFLHLWGEFFYLRICLYHASYQNCPVISLGYSISKPPATSFNKILEFRQTIGRKPR